MSRAAARRAPHRNALQPRAPEAAALCAHTPWPYTHGTLHTWHATYACMYATHMARYVCVHAHAHAHVACAGVWPTAPFFGLVCYSPEHLHPGQRGPHTDMSAEPQLAMIHFLTDWGTAGAAEVAGGDSAPSGGTSFYRERKTQTAHFGRDSCAALPGGSHFCKGSLAYNCSRNRAPPHACAGVPNSMSGEAAAYRTSRPSYISAGARGGRSRRPVLAVPLPCRLPPRPKGSNPLPCHRPGAQVTPTTSTSICCTS